MQTDLPLFLQAQDGRCETGRGTSSRTPCCCGNWSRQPAGHMHMGEGHPVSTSHIIVVFFFLVPVLPLYNRACWQQALVTGTLARVLQAMRRSPSPSYKPHPLSIFLQHRRFIRGAPRIILAHTQYNCGYLCYVLCVYAYVPRRPGRRSGRELSHRPDAWPATPSRCTPLHAK